jgi:hypothetical protein
MHHKLLSKELWPSKPFTFINFIMNCLSPYLQRKTYLPSFFPKTSRADLLSGLVTLELCCYSSVNGPFSACSSFLPALQSTSWSLVGYLFWSLVGYLLQAACPRFPSRTRRFCQKLTLWHTCECFCPTPSYVTFYSNPKHDWPSQKVPHHRLVYCYLHQS